MLYLIGLGLNDEKDLSLKAVESLKKCGAVYAEFYTNVWNGNIKKLEREIGKKIIILEREKVESVFLVKDAKEKNVALLVPGDPLSATTHTELIIEAKKNKVRHVIIHSSSIYTAVAECGLHLYKFGRTTTLVKPGKKFDPESPYVIIKENRKAGLHTLVLLDIGMTIEEGLALLEKHNCINPENKIIGCSQLGSQKQQIKYGPAKTLSSARIPATLIIPGKLNFKEEEFLEAL